MLTKEQLNDMLQLLEAHRDGKKIEYQSIYSDGNDRWLDIEEPLFNFANYRYRVKVKPEESNDVLQLIEVHRYRPWLIREVPTGAWIRWNECGKTEIIGRRFGSHVIVGTVDNNIIPSVPTYNICWSTDFMLRFLDYSLDRGKSWHPCGVLVS